MHMKICISSQDLEKFWDHNADLADDFRAKFGQEDRTV